MDSEAACRNSQFIIHTKFEYIWSAFRPIFLKHVMIMGTKFGNLL